MRLLRVAPIAVILAAALLPSQARAEALLEAQVMAKIRAARPSALINHSGLQAAARHHSMNMSRRGGLSHEGADARVNSAPPDPVEGNGSPDDGFGVASWCENVTYSMAVPEREVAQRIYQQWARSGAHNRCMMDGSRNVGAVGIYYDGQTWWATFIAQKDATPPGGSPPPKPSTEPPAPTAAPVASAPAQPVASQPAAQPLPSAETDPVGEAAKQAAETTEEETPLMPGEEPMASDQPSTITFELDDPAPPAASSQGRSEALPVVPLNAGYGWQELASLAVVLTIATFFLRRATRSPVPKPEVFLEWAAANTESEREREPVGV